MEKIDRLGWTVGLSFVAHGVRIGVRLNDAALLPAVLVRLPAGARPMPPERRVDYLYSLFMATGPARANVRRFHLMYMDSTRVVRTIEPNEILASLERYLEETLIVGAPRRTFLHAGVVGWRGRALVLPGRSRAGKSTLVAELVRAGATYLSDEYAVLDDAARAHPF